MRQVEHAGSVFHHASLRIKDAGEADLDREVAEVSVGDEFGGDADGDFGDGLGADVEAERGVDLGEGLAGDAFAQEVVEDEFDLAAAADHADVACWGFGEVE